MRHLLALTFLLVLAIAGSSHATERFAKVGTYGFFFLNLPTDPRTTAMANAGVADLTARSNAVNPAVMALADGATLTQANTDWIANVDLLDVGVHGGMAGEFGGLPLHFGGAIGYKRSESGTDPGTVFLPGGSGRTYGKDWSVSLTGAGAYTGERYHLAVGVAVKPTVSDVSGESINAWAFDTGVLGGATFAFASGARITPTVGISVTNFGPDADFSGRNTALPRQTRGGGGVTFEGPPVEYAGRAVPSSRVSVFVDRIYEETTGDDLWAVGAEVGLLDFAYFRLGTLDNRDQAEPHTDTIGVGLAWSYRHVRLFADYASYEVDLPIIGERTESFGAGLTYAF